MKHLAFAPLVLISLGCGVDPPKATTIQVGGEHEIDAVFPDGTRAVGYDQFEREIRRLVPPAAELDAMPIVIEDAPAVSTDPSHLRWQIGRYSVSIEPEYGYVGGCIRKHYLHLVLTFENQRIPAPLVELHLVAWLDKNQPCIGVMNTSFVGYGFCQKICWGTTKEDVKRTISQGLVAAGIGGTTAAIMARILAPATMAALAL